MNSVIRCDHCVREFLQKFQLESDIIAKDRDKCYQATHGRTVTISYQRVDLKIKLFLVVILVEIKLSIKEILVGLVISMSDY